MITGAVLGSPISHSLSPVLHQAAFHMLGIEGRYMAIDVPSGTLNDFINNRGSEFDYLSLTMPLKEEVVGLGLATDEVTARIQSGNTLYRRDGKFLLTSTDGSGFLSALANRGLIEFENVLVLGAGGTSRAVVGALDSVASEIHVLGRSSTRQKALEETIRKSSFYYDSWTNEVDFSDFDLVVNTTPAGAADLLAGSIHDRAIGTLFDVIYKPWPTELAKRWADQGGEVISGLELLLYQGIDQLELVLGESLDRQSLSAHLRKELLRAAK